MIKEEILKTITKYNLIESGDRIVLGVSGGPDSICMLNILNELKSEINFEIFVAHVNHGLRENAKIDQIYVTEFCKRINVECFVLSTNVQEIADKDKTGLEEAGRKVRYDFFDEVLEKTGSNKIAIAHNKNDNVETIILNILRGCGPSGLKGILPKNGKYIRPLIEIKRELIEEYTKPLNPRHDESNDENEFSRNKIRNIVLPFIKEEFNPNIIDTITRLSEISVEENNYIEEESLRIYSNILVEEKNLNLEVYNEENKPTIILDLKKFNAQSKVIEKRIILLAINKIFKTTRGIEKIHIEDIIKMCNKGVGNKFLTPNKYTKVEIKNNKIVIFRL